MSEVRLNLLLQYYKDDPSDPFNAYALAMEYLGSDLTKAQTFFEQLLRDHPRYLPTYYHAAKLFQQIDERERAVEIFEKGIALAKDLKEHKSLRELQSAYDELLYE